MRNYTSNKKQGLIRTLVLVFIGILILSMLGIDLKETVESEMAQKNIGYVKATVITIWNVYLEQPAKMLWNFFVNLLTKNVRGPGENTDETSMGINYEFANLIEIAP